MARPARKGTRGAGKSRAVRRPTSGPASHPKAPRLRAVVLLSGGLDSATAAAWAKAEGHDLYALSFDYGQRHKTELVRAKAVAAALGAKEHKVLRLPLGDLGHSALTDRAIAVPDAPGPGSGTPIGSVIPSTYVPARNTVFLSFALGYAEVVGASAIVIGANALDYSGYPDCRPEYLEAFERMANLATKAGVEGRTVKVLAPLLHMTKRDIVETARRLKAPIAQTWSCYRGGRVPCGTCESCVLRAKGFAEAGVPDPAMPSRAVA
ncbi:MAG: 7-cyano-7-deazaguanine synthase [Thermoplasmata archaeon]|nr:7-cyano-7-deazaguanine synthase [Thermoplasmata archaeon]MEA3166047.1 7-cyano-7-deazaguanine synthase [Thermoplasmata archaeon]